MRDEFVTALSSTVIMIRMIVRGARLGPPGRIVGKAIGSRILSVLPGAAWQEGRCHLSLHGYSSRYELPLN